MEDIIIGRQSAGGVRQFNSPNGTNVAPVSNKRIRIIFAVKDPPASGVQVWPRSLGDGSALAGITLTAGSPNFVVRIEDFGEMIRDPWYADDNAGGATLTVFDVSLEREK